MHSEATECPEFEILSKVAKILRSRLICQDCSIVGSCYDFRIEDSLPSALLQCICMIEHRVCVQSQLRFGASLTDLAMPQLLKYNCNDTCRYCGVRDTTFQTIKRMCFFFVCLLTCKYMPRLVRKFS